MKLRRKQPGWHVAEQSLQGLMFWTTVATYLGGLECEPVAETRDRRMIFGLAGQKAAAALVESREEAVGDIWRCEMAFRSIGAGPVLEASLVAHGWDPWLHAEVTGDRTVVDLPPKKRRRTADERTAIIASERDECRITVRPEHEANVAVLGVSLDEIMELIRKARAKPADSPRRSPG